MPTNRRVLSNLTVLLIIFSIFTGEVIAAPAWQDTPECRVGSLDGLNPPEPTVRPAMESTGVVGRNLPLLPVPTSEHHNPANFPLVPPNTLLDVIGRASDEFGDWLYVGMSPVGQTYIEGFIRLEFTTYTGDIKTLQVIHTPHCSSVGTPPTAKPPESRTLFATIDVEGITFSLPDEWVFHDFRNGAIPQHDGLKTFIKTVPSMNGQTPLHLYIGGTGVQRGDDVDWKRFAIFYMGTYGEMGIDASKQELEDPASLAKVLKKGLKTLVVDAVPGVRTPTVEATRVVRINNHPYVFAHYSVKDMLPDDIMEKADITPEQNILDTYVLTTYKDGHWYMILVTGLRTTTPTLNTIINSVYIP